MFGLNIHPDFLSNNTTNALKGLSQPPPSQTFCDISQPQTSLTSVRAAPPQQLSTQAFRCFRYSSSVICLALYKDMLIPTVAIVMAMGLRPLLRDCIRTSPETCLCGEKVFKAPHVDLYAKHTCVVQKRIYNS